MRLPADPDLPVEHLAGAFRNTTNSYKFFWLLALIDHVRRSDERVVATRSMLAQMVARAWHPVHSYRLSFGSQDRLGSLTRAVQAYTDLPIHRSRVEVHGVTEDIVRRHEEDLASDLRSLLRFVPYRFLRPWFYGDLRGLKDYQVNAAISDLAAEGFDRGSIPLYRFVQEDAVDAIEVHPAWWTYLKRHHAVLEGFTLWHLTLYLQRNNPNVPALSEKLLPPEERDLKRAREFWAYVLTMRPGLRCIYSGELLAPKDFSVDHFVPWTFVSHDLMWNLAPVTPMANSSKSDALPDLDRYGEPFARLQYLAFHTVLREGRRNEAWLEDYVVTFNADLRSVAGLTASAFSGRLLDRVRPLVQIATNTGFRYGWRFGQ